MEYRLRNYCIACDGLGYKFYVDSIEPCKICEGTGEPAKEDVIEELLEFINMLADRIEELEEKIQVKVNEENQKN